jgi:hypothetical protein
LTATPEAVYNEGADRRCKNEVLMFEIDGPVDFFFWITVFGSVVMAFVAAHLKKKWRNPP